MPPGNKPDLCPHISVLSHNEFSYYDLDNVWSLGLLLMLSAEIILCICLANERRRYNATLSLIGWGHTQNDPFIRLPLESNVLLSWSMLCIFSRGCFQLWNDVSKNYISRMCIIFQGLFLRNGLMENKLINPCCTNFISGIIGICSHFL